MMCGMHLINCHGRMTRSNLASSGRRLRLFVAALGLVATPWATTAAPRPHLALGPMIGHVSPTDARVWVQSSGPARVRVRFSMAADLEHAVRASGPALKEESGFMGHVVLEGLQPSTRYYYSVALNGREAMLPPYPSFTTAPEEGSAGHVRFGFVSCVGYHGYGSTAGFADMARTNLDLLLMLGDNVYSNTNDPAVQRKSFADQRGTGGWRGLAPRVPVYAIWDDHDYGPDNSDGTMPGKEKSLRTFQELWANPSYGEPDNPGVYYRFSRGAVDFFMLDGRYYRDPNNATNLPHKTMLGGKQVDWLKRELAKSKATFKVIASGGEWQAYGTEDSWRSFKQERDDLLRFLSEKPIEGVLLLSGDRHFTGGYQVEGKWIEITTGPLGSDPATAKNSPEAFLNLSATKGHFYCVYDLDTAARPPTATLEVYRVGDGRVERRTFTWDEIRGATKLKLLPPPAPAK